MSGNIVPGIWWRMGQTACPTYYGRHQMHIGQQLNNCGDPRQTWSMEFCRRRLLKRNIVMWSRWLAWSVRMTWWPRRRDLSPGSCRCTPRSSWTIPVNFSKPSQGWGVRGDKPDVLLCFMVRPSYSDIVFLKPTSQNHSNNSYLSLYISPFTLVTSHFATKIKAF